MTRNNSTLIIGGGLIPIPPHHRLCPSPPLSLLHSLFPRQRLLSSPAADVAITPLARKRKLATPVSQYQPLQVKSPCPYLPQLQHQPSNLIKSIHLSSLDFSQPRHLPVRSFLVAGGGITSVGRNQQPTLAVSIPAGKRTLSRAPHWHPPRQPGSNPRA